jgi:8-oxo-dGTP pyrophosphatase MutT (NUDIX family)
VPGRIDYYNDPSAPKANSLVPSVNVVVTDEDGSVLVIQRSDNCNWAIPGGAIDLGESLAQAAVRETKEETGITCEVTGIVGIYTDPRHVVLYTSNGEHGVHYPTQRQYLEGGSGTPGTLDTLPSSSPGRRLA